MKKLIAILLTFILILSMAACADSTTSPDTTIPGTAATPDAPAAPESETESETTDESTAQADSDDPTETDLPAFEEVIIVDNEYCTAKITGIDPENFWGYTLNIYVENKSEDISMMFTIDGATINGVDCDPFWATEVVAGAKSNSEVNFAIDDLPEEISENITDICLSFRVYDYNDYMAEDYANETVHIYPKGEAAAEIYVREPQSSDAVLLDNEYATVTCIGFVNDELWGYTMQLYIENKTDVTMMVSMDDVTVNGFMIDPFWADDVMPGSTAFCDVSWSEEEFTANGITDVEEITFSMRGYNSGDWMADDFFNESIIVNP